MESPEFQHIVGNLQRSLDHGMQQITQRMDYMEERQDERHKENADRLDKINGKVGLAHDRVSKLEAINGIAAREMERVKDFMLGVPELIRDLAIPESAGDKPSSKDRPITTMEARWLFGIIIGVFAAGATVTVWLLKLVGKL